MVTLKLVLLVLAMVLFGLAAVGVSHPRGNFVAAGLFFLTLSMLV
jgi:hypothetical protein